MTIKNMSIVDVPIGSTITYELAVITGFEADDRTPIIKIATHTGTLEDRKRFWNINSPAYRWVCAGIERNTRPDFFVDVVTSPDE